MYFYIMLIGARNLSKNFTNIIIENKVFDIDPNTLIISVSIHELTASIKRSSMFRN